jgi:hypothetical protein
MIEIMNSRMVLVPAQLGFQLPFYPKTGLGKNRKTLNGFNTSFIHYFISPK